MFHSFWRALFDEQAKRSLEPTGYVWESRQIFHFVLASGWIPLGNSTVHRCRENPRGKLPSPNFKSQKACILTVINTVY